MAKKRATKVTMAAGGGAQASTTGRPILPGTPVLAPMAADQALLMSRQSRAHGEFQPYQNIPMQGRVGEKVFKLDPCRAATRALGEPRLRKGAHAEILFLGPAPAAQVGVAPGEYVRLCFGVGLPGYLVAVSGAYEASLVVREFEWQLKNGRSKGNLERAALTVAARAAKTVTLGGWAGEPYPYTNVLDEGRW